MVLFAIFKYMWYNLNTSPRGEVMSDITSASFVLTWAVFGIAGFCLSLKWGYGTKSCHIFHYTLGGPLAVMALATHRQFAR